MNKKFATFIALAGLGLSACNQTPADNLADRVEDAADARADSLENQAEALEQRAEQVRETGDQRSDAISAADRNVATMSADRRDAIVANEAPAVR